METISQPAPDTTLSPLVITPEALQEHWQGHRRLTRRVIEVFPEDELFTYSIGGMRPFSELALEMIQMAAPGISGVATGQWSSFGDLSGFADAALQSKQELLSLWDRVTQQIDLVFPQISPRRFQEVEAAFGQYENPIYATLLYFIDNEIHHRGQGYVYLRSLGIEPPAFWDRH
jgi:uncharacterized damage-inducible protein DinB